MRSTSRASMFDRYSFDLIYARPRQTPEEWADELKRALSEAGEHLSLYQLTIEQDTPFAALHAAGKLKTPDDDTARALYDITQEICAAHGLPAYEISNHARPGGECRHNLVYWRAHEYAGIGPGAHGRLDIDGDRHATATEKRPETWLMRVEADGHGLITDDMLTREEMSDEFLLMGLRLAEGIDIARFKLAGRPSIPARSQRLHEHGLIETTAAGPAAGHAAWLSGARRGGRRSGGLAYATRGEAAKNSLKIDKPPYIVLINRLRFFGPGPCFEEDFWLRATDRADSESSNRTCYISKLAYIPEAPNVSAAAKRLRSRRRHPQHREPALVGAVVAEAEQAVDAGKARRIGQDAGENRCVALGLHQRGDQRDGVVGERRGAHRFLLVAGAVALGEAAVTGAIRRRIPAAVERRRRELMRGSSHSPVPSNWIFLVSTPFADQHCDDVRHRVAAVGNKERLGARRDLGDIAHRAGHGRPCRGDSARARRSGRCAARPPV